jgi:lysozyme family protein
MILKAAIVLVILGGSMQTNFVPSTNFIVKDFEGEYSNDPHDAGGATMEGVTQATYDAYRASHKLPTQPVKRMSIPERNEIYKFEFWDAIKGDYLVSGFDLSIYDCAINSGPPRAIKLLQKTLGLPADGKIGHTTIQALQTVPNVTNLITAYNNKRLSWLHALRDARFFDRTWSGRVAELNKKSLEIYTKGSW